MNNKFLRVGLIMLAVCLAAVVLFFVVKAGWESGKQQAKTMMQVEEVLFQEPDTTVVVPPDAIPPIDMQAR